MDQQLVNWDDPEQHFAWALKHLPMFEHSALTHPQIVKQWSQHLVECGFVHRDHLVSKANGDGHIHVDDLPVQKKRLHRPVMGQNSYYNNGARWAGMEEKEPERRAIPDIRQFTPHENAAILAQFEKAGLLKREFRPVPDWMGADDGD